MVDTERRKKLALHLRHLSVGVTTNDDFEESIMDDVSNGWLPEQYYRSKKAKEDDPIIVPMLDLCWGLYDDTRNHFVKDLDEEAFKIIARYILFLRSDKEYEWPYFDINNPLLKFSLKDFVLTILSLGQHYRSRRKEQLLSYTEWQKVGDYNVWPFFRQTDYEDQLKKPPFLNGQQKQMPGN